jgi:hypothetical protein
MLLPDPSDPKPNMPAPLLPVGVLGADAEVTLVILWYLLTSSLNCRVAIIFDRLTAGLGWDMACRYAPSKVGAEGLTAASVAQST